MMNKNTKRAFYAGRWYTLPFRANGLWIEDATGKPVAEGETRELAKSVAESLTKVLEENSITLPN
jgi:hypothetical protein